MTAKKYCVCCGEDVPFHTIERNERKEVVCSHCGFPLEVKPLWEAAERSNTVAFIAEDSDIVRRILADVLAKKKFVHQIVSRKHGVELLKSVSDVYQARAIEKKDVIPLFAIIDLNMPVMDGITAARAIRDLEQRIETKPMPIIFFSSLIANERLRAVLNTLPPAVYINKGNNPDAHSLVERVNFLLNFIGEKYIKETV